MNKNKGGIILIIFVFISVIIALLSSFLMPASNRWIPFFILSSLYCLIAIIGLVIIKMNQSKLIKQFSSYIQITFKFKPIKQVMKELIAQKVINNKDEFIVESEKEKEFISFEGCEIAFFPQIKRNHLYLKIIIIDTVTPKNGIVYNLDNNFYNFLNENKNLLKNQELFDYFQSNTIHFLKLLIKYNSHLQKISTLIKEGKV
mgnify:CR=1 FL=1